MVQFLLWRGVQSKLSLKFIFLYFHLKFLLRPVWHTFCVFYLFRIPCIIPPNPFRFAYCISLLSNKDIQCNHDTNARIFFFFSFFSSPSLMFSVCPCPTEGTSTGGNGVVLLDWRVTAGPFSHLKSAEHHTSDTLDNKAPRDMHKHTHTHLILQVLYMKVCQSTTLGLAASMSLGWKVAVTHTHTRTHRHISTDGCLG